MLLWRPLGGVPARYAGSLIACSTQVRITSARIATQRNRTFSETPFDFGRSPASSQASQSRRVAVECWRRYCNNSSGEEMNTRRNNNDTKISTNNVTNSKNGSYASGNTENSLLKQLKDQIRMTGPITVHQYMRAVLTHPRGGYYMDHDPLGEEGDFITSPEISQMFGELLGVWVYSEWHKMGMERPLQLIELGPGRGTLVKDVLRSLQQLGLAGGDLHVHLVEISPHYRRLQRRTLCPSARDEEEDPCEQSMPSTTPSESPVHWHQHLDTVPAGFSIFLAHEFFDALPIHKLVKTDAGKWREVLIDISGDVGYGGYGDADSVSRLHANESSIDVKNSSRNENNSPDDCVDLSAGMKKSSYNKTGSLYDANQSSRGVSRPSIGKTESSQDTSKSSHDTSGSSHVKTKSSQDAADQASTQNISKPTTDNNVPEELPLRYVLSKEATPASTIYTKDVEERDMIEVCPDAHLIAGQIATRITERGGALLVVDYGHTGSKGDTFRAFRQHRQQHPLLSPGSADLTADVDFSLLKKALPQTVVSFGPVSQGFFLKNMGIELRLVKLLQSCRSAAAHSALVSSYRRLVEEMGGAFSVWAVYPRVMEGMLKKFPPPGFVRHLDEGWSEATMQRIEDLGKKMAAQEETPTGKEQ